MDPWISQARIAKAGARALLGDTGFICARGRRGGEKAKQTVTEVPAGKAGVDQQTEARSAAVFRETGLDVSSLEIN